MNKNEDMKRNSDGDVAKVKVAKSRDRSIAELALSTIFPNALTARRYSKGICDDELSTLDLYEVLKEKADKVKTGDLTDLESALVAQATTLDTMFNELARRAANAMGTHVC